MGKKEDLERRYAKNIQESLADHGGPAPPAPPSPKYAGLRRCRAYADVPIDQVIPDPAQPRKSFDEGSIEGLALSIREKGQLVPIRCRWDEGLGKWVVLAGERRYRACGVAGVPTVRVELVEGELSPAQVLAEQLIENCQREDLRPVERAEAFERLMELEGWTGAELAAHLHLHPSTVSRALALLDRLPEDLRDKVSAGELGAQAAYELTQLHDPDDQRAAAGEAIAGGMSAKDTRERVRRQKGGRGGRKKPGRRTTTYAYRTPRRWQVTVVAPGKEVSELEVASELEDLARQLRAGSGGAASAA
jgi:ParB family chromosome partitioning protein